MASFGYTIDTNPMASEMKQVTEKVGGVTKAVVGMQAAVILAETEASNTVCKRLNNGFFQLIYSQLAQKSVTAKSETSAIGMEMVEQQKALLKLKERMNGDYRMIASRYKDLFDDLNKELHTRITELDRPVMDFVEKDINVALKRVNRHVAAVPVNQSESLTLSQHMVAARIKKNAQNLIVRMKEYLIAFKKQQNETERIRINRPQAKVTATYIPVLIYAGHGEASSKQDICLPPLNQHGYSSSQTSEIRNRVLNAQSSLAWKKTSASEEREVNEAFLRKLNQAPLSDRVKNTARKLFEQNAGWQKL